MDTLRMALDRVVALARGGDDDALAGRLACYTGVSGPGTLHVRPCVAPAGRARTEAVATHLRTTYGTDTPYVIDWLKAADADDKARADRFRERIGAFLRRVGATGWGFTG